MNKLEIDEINILPVKPQNGLVAFASIVINQQFYVGDIAIYSSPSTDDGFRLVYPCKVLPNGKKINCFHRITKIAGEAVHNAVISKYQGLMEKVAEHNNERAYPK